MIKVQLTSNKLGTVNLSKVDPESLDKLQEHIKRSSENDGVVYSYSTTLKFDKIGREFIKQAYQLDGIEALVVVNIYEHNGKYGWFLSSSGKVNFISYIKDEIGIAVNLDQFNFNVTFNNQINQDVSMSVTQSQNGMALPELTLVNLKLQPKSLLKEYLALPSVGNSYSNTPALTTIKTDLHIFGVFDTSNLKLGELDDSFGYQSFMGDITDFNNYQAKESGTIDEVHIKGKMNFTMNLRRVTVLVNPWTSVTFQIKYYLKHRDKDGVTITDSNFYTTNFVCNGGASGAPSYDIPPFTTTNTIEFDYTLAGPINVIIGDTFIVYYEFHSISMVASGGDTSWIYYSTGGIVLEVDSDNTFIDIKQNTIFPESTCKGIMAYELCERLCQYYTNQINCFKSTVLGRTDLLIPYDADGEAALIAFTNGWAIRKSDTHQLFFNFKDVMQVLASAFGLGWGFEQQEDGTNLVVVEKIEYFYNRNLKILDLGQLPKVKTKVLADRYSQIIKYGYRDLKQIKQLNAVDEFNQGRQAATPLTQISNTLDLSAGQISASGYEIENQRRQASVTTNSPLDEDRFIICALRDGAPVMGIQSWKNERAEDFTDITNLYDPASAYNLRIRPGKALRRWSKIIATNVVYGLNKVIKFSSGTGNYNLVCKGSDDNAAFSENANLDLTGVFPVYVPEGYEIPEWSLNRDQWRALLNSKYGYIQFKDGKETNRGLLLDVERNPTTRKVKFELLKIFLG